MVPALADHKTVKTHPHWIPFVFFLTVLLNSNFFHLLLYKRLEGKKTFRGRKSKIGMRKGRV